MEEKPQQNKHDHDIYAWRSLALLASTIIGSGILAWTGASAKLSEHDKQIEQIKRDIEHQGRVQERMEDKIDRLLKRP